MSKVFISYRRSDSEAASGRIADRLRHHFGAENVFRDLESIKLGVDFEDRISNAVDQSAVQLVFIGQHWLDATDEQGRRRLDQPDDPVRTEIRLALQKPIPVIPVLIDGVAFPPTEALPSDIGKLTKSNGLAVRNGYDFEQDMSRLLARVWDYMRVAPAATGLAPEEVLPAALAELGFTYHHVKSVDALVPPTIQVPAGPFSMGTNDGPADEQPEHSGTLRSYGIAVFPITVAEYLCYVRAGNRAPFDNEVSWQEQQERPEHPVVNVSWFDARGYALRLSKITGQSWRLPTEAEWERAAKWDATRHTWTTYPWGEAFESGRSNTRERGIRGTTPITAYGPKGASPCGANDMAGNVWEWTSSLWRPYRYSSTDGRERVDSPDPRIRRGGSWDSVAANARTTKRAWSKPDYWDATIGFRLAIGPGVRG